MRKGESGFSVIALVASFKISSVYFYIIVVTAPGLPSMLCALSHLHQAAVQHTLIIQDVVETFCLGDLSFQ